jgi:hypothetical protein
MPRYYYSELANRPISDGNVTVNFEKTAIIGSNIVGIYATDDPGELAVLNGAVQLRAGVMEISQQEYEEQLAQKKTTLNSLPSSVSKHVVMPVQSRPLPVAERSGVESVVSAEPKLFEEIKTGTVEDPKSVIKVDNVASPDFVKEEERTAPVKPEPKVNKKANVRAVRAA